MREERTCITIMRTGDEHRPAPYYMPPEGWPKGWATRLSGGQWLGSLPQWLEPHREALARLADVVYDQAEEWSAVRPEGEAEADAAAPLFAAIGRGQGSLYHGTALLLYVYEDRVCAPRQDDVDRATFESWLRDLAP